MYEQIAIKKSTLVKDGIERMCLTNVLFMIVSCVINGMIKYLGSFV